MIKKKGVAVTLEWWHAVIRIKNYLNYLRDMAFSQG